ncbi:MAG: aminotransferase class V-fold PLP-dependent enzyme [Propionicimonas sp.]|uniref:pyridoxal phosphate-dependent decarboxylase family protein n=1 Tax=Propionicimonas sp. TaxID=1955623 RepID=UPI002B1FD40E|nr:aminotransferase class V-fold PLP-dependent enzyme [Propionicimonas sp.]MEA4944550.1 aminotransferase class V-fold PLP-dependent enzyme [Propionicimonas sp.]
MPGDYETALDAAHALALAWLQTMPTRPIAPVLTIDQVKDRLGRDLAAGGAPAGTVVAQLADAVEPGLIAMQSPRFYGFVTGGTYPAALGADWLVSAWDQNASFRSTTPGVVAVEELAGDWLCELLGLPPGAAVGFTTGATSANLACLLSARNAVLRAEGWDVEQDGLQGAPRLRLLAGASVHGSLVAAGRMAGLGLPRLVEVDDQGRIDPDALAMVLAGEEGPAIVALQAGDVHSGAFDDFTRSIAAAHAAGAWVHVDGAFGLWAAASPSLRHLVAGHEAADSWATDAHKTLNVPYDSGVAIVRDPAAMTAALGQRAAYLPEGNAVPEPQDRTVELSRRARGVPIHAALRALGRDGVAALLDGLVMAARALADGFDAIPGLEVLNDVAFTQVCLAGPDDTRTAALGDWLRAEGTTWPSSSHWRGRAVVRFSVSNYGTDDQAVRQTLDAVRRGAQAVGIG